MASFKQILAKTLTRFIGDTLPQKAADQADRTQAEIQRVYTGLGAAFGQKISDRDITFAIKREPVAHRIVFTVAHDIYDNWFEVEPIEEEEDKEAFDEAVQKALSELNAKDVFTQATVYERAYGWSIIILGYQDKGEDLKSPILNAEKIVDLEAYGPPQIPKVDVDEDQESSRYGQPEIYTVKRSESEIVSCYYSSIFERIWHLINRYYS